MSANAEQRAWQLVLEHIEQCFLDARLGPGDRLPSERELAAQLGVGRSSVREAFRVLEIIGLIRTSSGSGPSSGAIVIATPSDGLSVLMRLQVAARAFPLADVVQTRLVLEDAVAASLASNDIRDLSEPRRLLDAMDADDLSAEDFLALDAQFHLSLAESSGNVVITAMMAGLRTAIESYVLDASTRIDGWDAMTARLRAEHRDIVAAFEAADADAARRRVRDHITTYYRASGMTASTGKND
ncbi:FadR/GntR family transcriptional regulator [Microbacterium sp. A196]|uniref:FadR/GntR family transcriptional regulator n=1 Tax=unclassified Microbacterium TaxID=2609290 RepID=UPI003FD46F66